MERVMSDKTDALLKHLRSDLSHVLDEYQLDYTFSSTGPVWPAATEQQYKAFALGRSLLKKYNEKDNPSREACAVALSKFLSVNERCGEWRLTMQDLRDEELVNGVKDVIYRFWYVTGDAPLVSSLDQLYDRGRLGSGMNRFARGSDLYTKLWDSPLSCTDSNLLAMWRRLVSRDIRWAVAERHRHKEYGTQLVAGNKLSFVNKNVTTARCISTEPTVNMWFQLGLESLMRERLTRTMGLNLETQQEINRVLARRGSRTGRFATIDLESASDSVSMGLLEAIMPPSFLWWLKYLRSPVVQLPNGNEHVLKMVSTMGNGFTFPLETLIFAAVVISAYRHHGIKPVFGGKAMKRNLGVFGDDIIVETKAYRTVVRLLELLGFVVNRDKTYASGPFRESCGGDYVNGRHCRGVYVKRLRTKQDYAVAINLLNRWTAHTGIFLPATVQYLMRKPGLLRVPPYENDDAGVHMPFDKAYGKHQRHGLVRYKSFVARAATMMVEPDGSVVLECKDAQRTSNPEALYLAFLHGDIRGYRLSLRQRHTWYTTKHKVTSSWDTLSPQSRAQKLGWRRWSDAVYYNLSL
jgi:hypothetical protein